jgi:transposase-like protein
MVRGKNTAKMELLTAKFLPVMTRKVRADSCIYTDRRNASALNYQPLAFFLCPEG